MVERSFSFAYVYFIRDFFRYDQVNQLQVLGGHMGGETQKHVDTRRHTLDLLLLDSILNGVRQWDLLTLVTELTFLNQT